MWSVVLLLPAALLVNAASTDSKTYRFTHIFGDVSIPQDISVDEDANTVMIAVGDVSRYPGHVSTLNFHDFDTDYVAFKDIRKGICLLAKAPVKEPQENLYAKRTTNVTMAFDTNVKTDIIDPFVVESVAGDRIADFCQDYNTYFMTLIPKDLTRPVPEIVVGHCKHHCFHCVLWTSCNQYESLR